MLKFLMIFLAISCTSPTTSTIKPIALKEAHYRLKLPLNYQRKFIENAVKVNLKEMGKEFTLENMRAQFVEDKIGYTLKKLGRLEELKKAASIDKLIELAEIALLEGSKLKEKTILELFEMNFTLYANKHRELFVTASFKDKFKKDNKIFMHFNNTTFTFMGKLTVDKRNIQLYNSIIKKLLKKKGY